jgi:hypothetical protein
MTIRDLGVACLMTLELQASEQQLVGDTDYVPFIQFNLEG